MKTNRIACALAFLLLVTCGSAWSARLKDLARFDGDREYRLVGYGLVIGLSGSGDSEKNRATRLALANALTHFQVTVKESELASRNTAAVIVTAEVGAWRGPGDRIDVQVSSLGDARSLQGGTLMLTPLLGADEQAWALAQGAVTTGAWAFERNASSVQRNHPTVGVVSRGATIERTFPTRSLTGAANEDFALVLDTPDITTAQRVRTAIEQAGGVRDVRIVHPGRIEFAPASASTDVPALLARLESLAIEPDRPARLVINERTGTLVAGGDIRLGQAVIAQDDLRIEINTEYNVSQPYTQVRPGDAIATVTVPHSDIDVDDSRTPSVVAVDRSATVLDLVNALRKAQVPAKSMVSIFQSLREAGALNADIVVQ